MGDETKDKTKDKSLMPCHGVMASDNSLVNQYLNRTGASGSRAWSIHVVSKEQFNTGFRCLVRNQKDEVVAAQRAEWVWRNDHLNL